METHLLIMVIYLFALQLLKRHYYLPGQVIQHLSVYRKIVLECSQQKSC